MHSNGEVSSSDSVLTFKFGPDESILACWWCKFFFLLRSENFDRPTCQRFLVVSATIPDDSSEVNRLGTF